ncbi:hypothetical protein ACIA5D_10230 [Actinoplanes sp. NPDC051513]|uniref:hypothetical protein n=1 Tax=Actinoplanes sp. NPDC051513 TaxID=3363908 RepID=UPI00378B80BA
MSLQSRSALQQVLDPVARPREAIRIRPASPPGAREEGGGPRVRGQRDVGVLTGGGAEGVVFRVGIAAARGLAVAELRKRRR